MWYDMMWCDMIWCDMIWCDVIWYDMMWCDMIWYDVMWYDVMWCDVMWYDMMWCDMIWYDVIWYDVMWCDMKWCDVMWYDMMWCDMIWCDMIWYDVMWCDMIVMATSGWCWWHLMTIVNAPSLAVWQASTRSWPTNIWKTAALAAMWKCLDLAMWDLSEEWEMCAPWCTISRRTRISEVSDWMQQTNKWVVTCHSVLSLLPYLLQTWNSFSSSSIRLKHCKVI